MNTRDILLGLAGLMLPGLCQAQGYYLKAGAGYNLNLNSRLITSLYSANYVYTPNYDKGEYETSYSIKEEGVYGSFGSGTGFHFAGGRTFSSNISLELLFSHSKSPECKGSVFIGQVYADNGANLQETQERTYSGTLSYAAPSLVFRREFSKSAAYLRVGLVAAKASYTVKSRYHLDRRVTLPDTIKDRTMEFTGDMAFGSQLAAGIERPLDRWISVYAELCLTNLAASPSRGELKEYRVNGSDHMQKASAYERSVDFNESFSYTSADEYSRPEQTLRSSSPFGSWGVNIGVQYAPGRKRRASPPSQWR
jgi:hypothetical protein